MTKNENTHTQGPWTIHQDYARSIIGADGTSVAGVTSNKGVPPIKRPSEAEWEANARLIAAAPDMLEVLEFVMRCDEKGFVDLKLGLHNRIQNAISKAKGE